jgi:hypothetical protein
MIAKLDAVERRLSALERRIEEAELRNISDVVAQCIIMVHRMEELHQELATGHSETRCDDVHRGLHRIVHFLAALSGTDLRDIGGDLYLLYAYAPEALAANGGKAA